MMKFKVGDEVRLGRMSAKVIHIESTGDFPYLVEREDNRIEFCNDAELTPILPAVPDGWTPASEPAAQVRYAVRHSNTVKDKDDDGDYYLTMDEAIVEAKRLVAKYGKEIEVGHWVVDAVVKPAEPEVIRMEE